MSWVVSGAAAAKLTSAPAPPASIRPGRLARAWRYHGFGPPADRTYRSFPARTTHIVVKDRSDPS